jgi:molybdopterin/thiamine biosynthesis adenylyltransferase
MNKRYLKNQNSITEDEQTFLSTKSCAIVGCGGLGEYIAQHLLRLGIIKISIIDPDAFEETNLNRQLYCTELNLGKTKTEETKLNLLRINKNAEITTVNHRLTAENGLIYLKNHDLVFDAIDSINDRIMLQQLCEKLNIPLVSASIAGWYGQITFIYPGDNTLQKVYKHAENFSIEKETGNPAFTPAIMASWQVSEALKYFLNKGDLLRNKLLVLDLLFNETTIIDF